MNEETNDPNDNEEIVNGNQQYNNDDDDDFLSAPGGLLNDNVNNDNDDENGQQLPSYNNNISNPTDDNINNNNQSSPPEEEEKNDANAIQKSNKPNIIKISKPTSIPYGLSDDTSDSSDDDLASRKFTHQSQPTEDDLADGASTPKPNDNNNKNLGKQYSILLNDKSFLNEPDAEFPDNYIKTAKYSLLTFIPLNLFEQFRRIANIYFLVIIGIQLLPQVSPFPIGTSIMPLAFILTIGAIKDGIEDWDRHKADKIANSIPILRLNPSSGQFKKTVSSQLQPSDIILIKRNHQVPADCIVLGCDNSNGDNSGVCYINTSSMDGENAPKLRRAIRATVNITNTNDLCKLKGYIKCPANTKSLHGFTGALSIKRSTLPKSYTLSPHLAINGKQDNNNNKKNKMGKLNEKGKQTNYGTITEDEQEPEEDDDEDDDDDVYLNANTNKNKDIPNNNKLGLNPSNSKENNLLQREEGDKISGLSDINFVFRGSKLVNTEYIYALVLFVGRETKLMLNRNQVPFKFSKFETILNQMIASILIFNFILCVAFGLAANVVVEPYPELERSSWITSFALDTCSWLILTSWMIPFSLYVTLELVKMIQAQWVSWDEKMTYDPITNKTPVPSQSPSKDGNNKSISIERPQSVSVESVDSAEQKTNADKSQSTLMREADDTIDHSWDDEFGGKARHAKTKNSNLNEELGHIDYVFTDKTGTLTQNLMELSKCSVGGKKFQNDHHAESNNVNISGDFTPFSRLIMRTIAYQDKKKQSLKLHLNKQQGGNNNNNNTNINTNNLINHINNDLNEQFQRENHELLGEIQNKNKSSNKSKYSAPNTLSQLQHDTHFLFNLLLCSATLPSRGRNKKINNNGRNGNNKTPNSDDGAMANVPKSGGNSLGLNPQHNLVASRSRDDVDPEAKRDETESQTVMSDSITEIEPNNNTLIPEYMNDDSMKQQIEFMSPSPDEVAFAEALCAHGIILEERQADGTMIIRCLQEIQSDKGVGTRFKSIKLKFKILATLDFTARRKRMTVIVEDELGEIHLYCKGADSTLFRLCNEESVTLIHETKRHVTSFARGGSRTLVMGWKKLSSEEYDEFDRYYREAEVALNNRQQLIENAFSYLEHSLYLLGCTAVEDQMQDGVPEAIYKLKDAKIKVIMLTGDKQETAVSIGRQSLIIGSNILDSELMFLQARTPTNPKDIDALEKQMRRVDKKLKNFIKKCEDQKNNHNNDNLFPTQHSHHPIDETDATIDKQPALILNGDALEMCLHPELVEKFITLFEFCSTIVCNRCNPAQKAMLVAMAKNRLDGVALAIGDGANDVSMIQAANVGIGIMGKEGTQASLAADFVLHRFKHIIRLLFVHGRYSFLRTAQVSLISLYKNMAFMLTVCYYGFYSLYTAQSCFDPYLMSAFNLFFAALFPLCVGAFEKDISQQTCLNHPKAYHYFKINSFFNIKYFMFWMFTALWQSLVWFWIATVVYFDNLDIWQSGKMYENGGEVSKNGGLWVWGTQIFTSNVIIICLKMMMETKNWNWTYYASTAIGLFAYVLTLSILSHWLTLDSDMFYMIEFVWNSTMNWLILIMQCVLCLGPGILYNLWRRERWASLSEILYEAEKFGYLTKNGIHRPTNDIIEEYLRR